MKKVLPFLKSDYFGDVYDKAVFEVIYDHVGKYNKSPDVQELSVEVSNRANSQDFYNGCSKAISDINSVPENNNTSWLTDKTEEWCKEKGIYQAMLDSMTIMEGKDKKRKPEAIPALLSEALAISFDPDLGHDYIGDYAEQYAYYHNPATRIPFLTDIFNKATDGGIPEKTLSVILAGIHVGKTMAMCNFAAEFLKQGYNVVYFTMEMSENEIVKRIDANILDVSLKDLRMMPESDYTRMMKQVEKNYGTGKLIVKEYPTSEPTVMHFESFLDELKLKKNGFKPDIIFIDYINICSSARFRQGGAGMYEYLKSIAEEIRGLAVKRETRVFTATQVNRTGFKSSDIDMEDTAESFGLPATADFMIALSTDENLKKLGQLSVKKLKDRLSGMSEYSRFLIGVDYVKQKLFELNNSTQGILQGAQNQPEGKVDDRKQKFRKIKT